MGDWQAFGHEDPCLSVSDYSHLNVSTNTSELMKASVDDDISGGLDLNTTSNSSPHPEPVRNCEVLSSSGHQCFWNPQSRITGDFCNTCLPVCLSKQTTINFYQFTLGIALISFATPLSHILVSAIASDIASVTSQVYYACCSIAYDCRNSTFSFSVYAFCLQGTIMGIILGPSFLARVISPFWRELYSYSIVLYNLCLAMIAINHTVLAIYLCVMSISHMHDIAFMLWSMNRANYSLMSMYIHMYFMYIHLSMCLSLHSSTIMRTYVPHARMCSIETSMHTTHSTRCTMQLEWSMIDV